MAWALAVARDARRHEMTSFFPGVISHDFQKKEALYNEYLQQVERQRERGWQIQKGWLSEPMVNEADGVPGGGADSRGRTGIRRHCSRAVSPAFEQPAGCRVQSG
jgi:hypothetical protein